MKKKSIKSLVITLFVAVTFNLSTTKLNAQSVCGWKVINTWCPVQIEYYYLNSSNTQSTHFFMTFWGTSPVFQCPAPAFGTPVSLWARITQLDSQPATSSWITIGGSTPLPALTVSPSQQGCRSTENDWFDLNYDLVNKIGWVQ